MMTIVRCPLLFFAFVLMICGTQRAVAQEGGRPIWDLPSEQVQDAVKQVRAGRSLQPAQWPNGAKVAVLLSFDVDNETLALVFGDGSVGALSTGEYGSRVGLKRVVDLLDSHRIPASFSIPAVSLQLAPQMADVITRSGRHEVGVHGWIHEINTRLSAIEERDFMVRSRDYLTEVFGVKPVGYRAPSWNFSPNTMELIQELGFIYDSSLMADDRPYEILAAGDPTGVVELPVSWILDESISRIKALFLPNSTYVSG